MDLHCKDGEGLQQMKKGLISFYSIHNFNFGVLVMGHGAETSCMCVCTKRVCVSNNEPKVCIEGLYSVSES